MKMEDGSQLVEVINADTKIICQHTMNMWSLGYFKESGVRVSDLFPFDDE